MTGNPLRGSGRRGRPIILPSKLTGKRGCIGDETKVIEGGVAVKERLW